MGRTSKSEEHLPQVSEGDEKARGVLAQTDSAQMRTERVSNGDFKMIARRTFIQSLAVLPLASRTLAHGRELFDGSWTQASRQRELPWRMRLPSASGTVPLVIYSHGLGGSREGGQAWGAAWADAGIAVLHLQHPGSDEAAVRQGGVGLRQAATADQFVERLLDVRFAIDELQRRRLSGEPPWSRIAVDSIGVAGHSFGALTTQAIAGQKYPGVEGLSDPRPKAFVALSPALPVGVKMDFAQAFADVGRPFFALTGSRDFSPTQGSASAQRAGVYDALPKGQRALLWLDGATHQTFGGNRVSQMRQDGSDPSNENHSLDRHSALIALATGAWWRWRLKGEDAARQMLESLDGLGRGDRLLIG